MSRRQTSLRPSEGGKFARPVGVQPTKEEIAASEAWNARMCSERLLKHLDDAVVAPPVRVSFREYELMMDGEKDAKRLAKLQGRKSSKFAEIQKAFDEETAKRWEAIHARAQRSTWNEWG